MDSMFSNIDKQHHQIFLIHYFLMSRPSEVYRIGSPNALDQRKALRNILSWLKLNKVALLVFLLNHLSLQAHMRVPLFLQMQFLNEIKNYTTHPMHLLASSLKLSFYFLEEEEYLSHELLNHICFPFFFDPYLIKS